MNILYIYIYIHIYIYIFICFCISDLIVYIYIYTHIYIYIYISMYISESCTISPYLRLVWQCSMDALLHMLHRIAVFVQSKQKTTHTSVVHSMRPCTDRIMAFVGEDAAPNLLFIKHPVEAHQARCLSVFSNQQLVAHARQRWP